ncbi:PhoH family protein [Haloglycomyces albus]|uniref:PhoH family protein n=1 Tax=Haloglycomyces albus TaxID=526067 RepID=UPI00046CAD88|nr:PhoH family protein [Haloglycomyces albus]
MPDQRTYVLDTSVLLSDPGAFSRFNEHHVVIPLIVITELEGKRHHPELGWFARETLRRLDDLRIKYRRLDEPVPIGDEGGDLRVEINSIDTSNLPPDMAVNTNDSRILAVAANLGDQAILVTKDMPLRVKASTVGVETQEYRHGQALDPTWTGTAELSVTDQEMSELFSDKGLDVQHDLPCHSGVILSAPGSSGLGRVAVDKSITPVKGDSNAFGLHGRSAEQRIALDLLLDDDVGIISLGGKAGTGKSALALCAGLEKTLEQQRHKKVVVFRPLYAVGGQNLGYLPGSESEKMEPWAQAVHDTLGALTSENVIDEVIHQGMLEVLPLTHIRGRSLHDSFVIVDEAQSLERGVLLTVLSRIGSGSRVVLTHDVAQRDNLRVGRHDGVTSVIESFKGHPLFAHVTLTRSERSPIAEMVTNLLET